MCELFEGKLVLSASILHVIRYQVQFGRYILHILWILYKYLSISGILVLQFLQISNTLFEISQKVLQLMYS